VTYPGERLHTAAVAGYVLSFTLPSDVGTARPMGGLFAFVFAVVTPLEAADRWAAWTLFAGWMANPLLWFGLTAWAFERPDLAFGAGVVAAGLAASLQVTYFALKPAACPAYLAWLLSMVLLAAAGWRAARPPDPDADE
jgi:hypothetical protein